jgi:hypothetical protein
VDLAIGAEVAAREWTDKDWMDARGSRFADELAEVLLVLGHRCLSWKVVGRLNIVVAELDEHVIRFRGQAFGPESVRAEGLCARSSVGHVEAVDESREIRAKAATIPSVVCLRGIADQFNAYRCARLAKARCRRLSGSAEAHGRTKEQEGNGEGGRKASGKEPSVHGAIVTL